LEGTYSPTNYVEEAVTLKGPDYTITVNDGRIEVVFRTSEPLPDADCRAAVRREVERIFEARMVLSGQPWEMSGLTLKRHYPDGRKDVWVSATSLVAFASMPSPDVIITGSDGNIVSDTKAERQAAERAFREQCLRHKEDSLLKDMMTSFRRAVDDPGDRMTHLYEI